MGRQSPGVPGWLQKWWAVRLLQRVQGCEQAVPTTFWISVVTPRPYSFQLHSSPPFIEWSATGVAFSWMWKVERAFRWAGKAAPCSKLGPESIKQPPEFLMGLELCCSALSVHGQSRNISQCYSALEKSRWQPLKEACEVGHPNREVYSLSCKRLYAGRSPWKVYCTWGWTGSLLHPQ